jgi:phosphate transport system protein
MREDLRFVYAVTKIITDLERIGDQGVNIANSTLNLLKTDGISNSLFYIEKPASEEILSMSSQIDAMSRDILSAFINEDENAAREILKLNSRFHETGNKAVSSLVIFASNINLPEVLDIFTNLLWIVRHLDRIGDHIMNVAERVCFIVTGVSPEFLKKKNNSM